MVKTWTDINALLSLKDVGVFYKLGFKERPMSELIYSGCLLFFRATFCKSRQSHSPLCSFLHLQNVISKNPASSSA